MVVGYLDRFGTSALLNNMKSNHFSQYTVYLCALLPQHKVFFCFFLAWLHNLLCCQIWIGWGPCSIKWFARKAYWKSGTFSVWALQGSNDAESVLLSLLSKLCNTCTAQCNMQVHYVRLYMVAASRTEQTPLKPHVITQNTNSQLGAAE